MSFKKSINALLLGKPSIEDLVYLLNVKGIEQDELLLLSNNDVRQTFNDSVLVRGVIELSNICYNDCKYCSMAKYNSAIKRYFLPKKLIIKTIDQAYENGIRIFHLSSGENDIYDIKDICGVVSYIRAKGGFVILVLGMKKIEDLKKLYMAGAETYISKFETSNPWLYCEINDKNTSLELRIEYLNKLKNIGFKIGTGNIVGLPFTNDYSLANDLLLTKYIAPNNASTSCFRRNQYSSFQNYHDGSYNKTLNYIAIMRLLLKETTIIPTNSSLGDDLKIRALKGGANLISINLTPEEYYKDYIIYNDDTRCRNSIANTIKLLEKSGLSAKFTY